MNPTTRQLIAVAVVSSVSAFLGAISAELACTPDQQAAAVDLLNGDPPATTGAQAEHHHEGHDGSSTPADVASPPADQPASDQTQP